MTLPQRRIGDLSVSALGLGCMPLSEKHMLPHRDVAIAVVHAALDAGITLFDTSNIYAPSWDTVGHNESLLAEAFAAYSGSADLADVLLTTKGGITRSEGEVWGRDARPAAMIAAAEASIERLGGRPIELYQFHRHDPSMTYADQMRSLKGVLDAGLVRRVGLSNVTLPELELGLQIIGGPADGGIVSVQNEFSPRYRADADVLERCTELGIAFLPWSPLGGSAQAHEVGSHYAAFAEVGAELGASPQEAVLAWLLRRSPVMIPIPGATKVATIASIARAATLELSDAQFVRLDGTTPAATSMFPEDKARSPLGA